MQIKPPWRPDLMSCHFNPKFSSQPVGEEMRAMGIEERRPSFFYEKVFGRTGGWSVYWLRKVGYTEIEPSHQRETCFIKDFDFTSLPLSEEELVKELKRFQESNIYEMEPIWCSLKLPNKWIEESASTNSALGEEEYQPTADDENYSKYTNST